MPILHERQRFDVDVSTCCLMTQGDERDTSYAQQYLDKVQETFSDDHAKYRQFLLIIDKFGREDNFLEVDACQKPLATQLQMHVFFCINEMFWRLEF